MVNVGFGVAGRGTALNEANADLADRASTSTASCGPRPASPARSAGRLPAPPRPARACRARSPTTSGRRCSQAAPWSAPSPSARPSSARRSASCRGFEQEFLRTGTACRRRCSMTSRSPPDELEPAVASLNRALPDINRLLGLGSVLERRRRGSPPSPTRSCDDAAAGPRRLSDGRGAQPAASRTCGRSSARSRPTPRTSRWPARGLAERRACPSPWAGRRRRGARRPRDPGPHLSRQPQSLPRPRRRPRGRRAVLSLAGKRALGFAAIIGGILVIVLGVSKPNPFQRDDHVLGGVQLGPGPRLDRPRHPRRRRQGGHGRRGRAGGRRRGRRADPDRGLPAARRRPRGHAPAHPLRGLQLRRPLAGQPERPAARARQRDPDRADDATT